MNTLGDHIDSLYMLRQLRLDKQKEVDEIKGREIKLKKQILNILYEAGLEKASGSLATAGRKTSIEPLVQDWDEVFAYIRAENRFELVQRRISAPAWRELGETGILVPGTVPNEIEDLSLTKSHRG